MSCPLSGPAALPRMANDWGEELCFWFKFCQVVDDNGIEVTGGQARYGFEMT